MYFATNVYGWTLLAKRDGKKWDVGRAMAEAKQAGIQGWEHYFRTVEEIQTVSAEAERHGLKTYSAYIGGAVHEPDLAQATVKNNLEIAEAARQIGVRQLIFNPDPLPDGALKSDQQLAVQTQATNELGKTLAGIGMRLLYHTHDPEMKAGARELHHVLLNTNAEWVGFCLDVHWIWRGAQGSQAALHDIISLYGSRISLIHLRQSQGGVWTESIGDGDIDYASLAQHLRKNNVKAQMTLELALEKESESVLSGEQASAQALEYLEPLLQGLETDPTQGNQEPWRIYLYGGGAIARQHAHAAAQITNKELLVADPSVAARTAFADAFPLARLFEDADSMLSSSPAREHDVVVIAVPPVLHHQAALRALQSGRHVLCEKPVTLSEQELDELLAASKKRHRIFGDCSVRFLCNDALPYSRAILSGGGIGSPYHARLVNRKPRLRPGIEFQPESKWFLNKDVAGGGAIYDWGVYDLTMLFDVLRPVAAHVLSAWLATPKTAVDPVDAPITIETHAGATIKLELASGDTVMLDFERGFGMHGEFQALLNVDGSEGGLSWEWCPPFDEEDKIKVTHWVDVDGKLDKRIKPFPAISWDDVHSRPLVAFLDLVAGRDSVITTLDRLKFNHLVLMAIYQCAENGSSVEVKLGT